MEECPTIYPTQAEWSPLVKLSLDTPLDSECETAPFHWSVKRKFHLVSMSDVSNLVYDTKKYRENQEPFSRSLKDTLRPLTISRSDVSELLHAD